ncbi:Fc.00g056370.m01.CDS01 [Cosmosporella sp. VM-42]
MDDNIGKLTDDIFQRLDEMEGTDASRTISILQTEISILEQEVAQQSCRLSTAISMLKETAKIIKIASSSIRSFRGQQKNAENVWAGYWGVVKEFEEIVFDKESVSSWEA